MFLFLTQFFAAGAAFVVRGGSGVVQINLCFKHTLFQTGFVSNTLWEPHHSAVE
jgi:hypothetical protein